MWSANVRPSVAEWEELPATLRLSLMLVPVWIEEMRADAQRKANAGR